MGRSGSTVQGRDRTVVGSRRLVARALTAPTRAIGSGGGAPLRRLAVLRATTRGVPIPAAAVRTARPVPRSRRRKQVLRRGAGVTAGIGRGLQSFHLLLGRSLPARTSGLSASSIVIAVGRGV